MKKTITLLASSTLLALVLSSPPALAAGSPCFKTAADGIRAADRRVTDAIRDRIAEDDTVSKQAQEIDISTADGVVTLRGEVASAEEQTVLASLAESVPGVRRVDDRMRVRSAAD